MHEAALAGAAIPSPSVVLGLLMRPYSLGHELFLLHEQNPFVNWSPSTDGKIPGPERLLEAVLFCSSTWTENQRLPSDRLLGLKLWIIGRRNRKANWPQEMLKFVAYRNSGSTEFPDSGVLDPDRQVPRTPGSPFLLRLHQWLMTYMRLSEVEAWDYPYGFAKMRWECHWESEGGFQIKNAEDTEFDAYVEEQERKRKECQA